MKVNIAQAILALEPTASFGVVNESFLILFLNE